MKNDMKNGWKIKKLGEVCELITCGVAARPNYVDDGVPFLSAKNVKDGQVVWSGYNCISEQTHNELTKNNKPLLGDILYTRVGSFGEAAVVEDDLEFSVFVSLTLIKVDKSILNNYFLKYYLNSDFVKKLAKKSISSSGVGNLNVSTVRGFPILLPPLPEQQRIVSILDEAFAAIAKAKSNAEQNLKNAKELFESYLQGVFSNGKWTMENGEWEEKRFDEICVLQRGFDLPTHARNEGIHPLVSSNGVTDRIDLWKVKAPGVVTGRSGTIGNVHYIEEDYWPLNTALYIKEFHGNYERFIYYFLKQFDLGKYSSGAGVPTLNRNNVHGVMVWFPKSIVVQKEFVQKLDALSAETKRLEAVYQQKCLDLEELKKSVLQKAFNGELTYKMETV